MQNQEEILIQQLASTIARRTAAVSCAGLSGSSLAFACATLLEETGRSIVAVVSNEKEAEKLIGDTRFFSNGKRHIADFPSYNISPFRGMSYSSDIAARRIDTLYRLISSQNPSVFVATIEALMHKTIPKQHLIDYAELVIAGEETDREALIEKLVSGGYSPSVLVEDPGDFSVRGGILDLFCPLYADPLQDELLRRFSIEVPIIPWPAPPKRLIRISGQVYNRDGDYEQLGRALKALHF